jgi:hypothetical protein
VSENWDLVRWAIRKFRGPGIDPDDIESEASVLLWRAALAWKRLCPFRPYATDHLKLGLRRFLERGSAPHLAGVRRDLREALYRVHRATAELLEEGTDQPETWEIAARAKLSVKIVQEVRALPRVHVGLDELEPEGAPSEF